MNKEIDHINDQLNIMQQLLAVHTACIQDLRKAISIMLNKKVPQAPKKKRAHRRE